MKYTPLTFIIFAPKAAGGGFFENTGFLRARGTQYNYTDD